jgi:hypothetical protein
VNELKGRKKGKLFGIGIEGKEKLRVAVLDGEYGHV